MQMYYAALQMSWVKSEKYFEFLGQLLLFLSPYTPKPWTKLRW